MKCQSHVPALLRGRGAGARSPSAALGGPWRERDLGGGGGLVPPLRRRRGGLLGVSCPPLPQLYASAGAQRLGFHGGVCPWSVLCEIVLGVFQTSLLSGEVLRCSQPLAGPPPGSRGRSQGPLRWETTGVRPGRWPDFGQQPSEERRRRPLQQPGPAVPFLSRESFIFFFSSLRSIMHVV